MVNVWSINQAIVS